MWFNDVELPDDLFRARDEEGLVIFAGAGVSCGPPSCLPMFPGLVDRIAQNAAIARPSEEEETLDHFLGRLHRNGNKVHQIAASILLDPESRPHALHDLLLRLFGKPEAVRLVTTNFDRHFSTASESLWKDAVREYHAPALPRGNCFRGIVYLHGAAFIDPEECVLTDEDFGRAYLTEGWTTRFLKDMFDRYTVLFIGYSHRDLVMNYLARGLPPSAVTRRFALHPEVDDSHWVHLGIKRVRYPVEGNDHGALTALFEAWVREVESGLAGRYQRLATLAAADPGTLSNDEADFVRRSLSRPDTARRFLNVARGPAWVGWLEQKGMLDRLLCAEKSAGPVDEEIARWLAANFLDDELETLLGLGERHRRNLHPCLWGHIHFRLQRDQGQISEPCFRRWVGILLASGPTRSKRSCSDLVYPAAKRGDVGSLVLLMDRLITPEVSLQPSMTFMSERPERTTAVTLDLLTDHEDHWLRQAWDKILRPALPTLAPKLELITRRALALADQLLRAPGLPASYDPFRHARPSLESRGTLHADAFDFLVEASLEVIRSRLLSLRSSAVAYLDELFGTGVPVLQRLAVVGVRLAPTLSADEKLRWLLSKRVLYSVWFHTEAFDLLKAEIAACSEAVKREALDAVMRGPEPDQREGFSPGQVDGAIFNLLHFLKNTDPSWKELEPPLDALQKRYPDFRSPAAPQPVVGPIAYWADPAEGFDLDAVLSEPAGKFLDAWLASGGDVLPGTPSSWDYGAVLPLLVKKSVSWALDLGKAALDHDVSLAPFWMSLGHALREVPHSVETWREILSLLGSALRFDAGLEFAAGVLEHALLAEKDGMPEVLFDGADALAGQLTSRLLASSRPLELAENWLQAAASHPGGRLWRYWLQRGLVWRKAQTESTGMPEGVARNVRALLAGDGPAARAARVLCGCEILLVDYLDSALARDAALPLFSWARDEDIALQTWSGFLQGGRWSAGLGDRLLQGFTETVKRWDRLPEASRRELGRHLAALAALGLQNPLEGGLLAGWLYPLPEGVLENFAAWVGRFLEGMEPKGSQAVWQRWLLTYLKQRSLGQPKPWTPGEVRNVPFWVLRAGSLFPAAVEALQRLPPCEGAHVGLLLDEMKKHDALFDYPDACAQLILAVADEGSARFSDPVELKGIVDRIKALNPSPHLANALDERMLRLGIASTV